MQAQEDQAPLRLNNHQKDTLADIFAHPTSHNIRWVDIVSLLTAIGIIEEKHDGKFRVQIGHEIMVFDRPRHKDMQTQQIIDLRRMLKKAGFAPIPKGSGTEHKLTDYAQKFSKQAIIAADFHHARIYTTAASNHSDPLDLTAPDPWHLNHNMYHRHENPDGIYDIDKIDTDEFFNAISHTLADYDEILLLGHGTGKANAAAALQTYLIKHYPNLNERIVATVQVDIDDITNNQLLQLGKIYFDSE